MKIIIATGGSGGHFFPALKLAETLKNDLHEVIFVGALNERYQSFIKDYKTFNIKASGFNINGFKSIINFFSKNINALKDSNIILNELKPDIVVGFGSYASFAVVMSAFLKKIPILIHEQNVVPGKANKILSFLASKIAISFKESSNYFPHNKVVFTGCPNNYVELSDANKRSIYDKYQLDKDCRTILLLGGSQGSVFLNDVFLRTLLLLKEKIKFQVIHVSGVKDFDKVKAFYLESGIKAVVFDFLKQINEAYLLADLIISRSGAVSLSEIILSKKPCILIPYPYANKHQYYNAKVLEKSNKAVILDQLTLTKEILSEEIGNYLNLIDQNPNAEIDIVLNAQLNIKHLIEELVG